MPNYKAWPKISFLYFWSQDHPIEYVTKRSVVHTCGYRIKGICTFLYCKLLSLICNTVICFFLMQNIQLRLLSLDQRQLSFVVTWSDTTFTCGHMVRGSLHLWSYDQRQPSLVVTWSEAAFICSHMIRDNLTCSHMIRSNLHLWSHGQREPSLMVTWSEAALNYQKQPLILVPWSVFNYDHMVRSILHL